MKLNVLLTTKQGKTFAMELDREWKNLEDVVTALENRDKEFLMASKVVIKVSEIATIELI